VTAALVSRRVLLAAVLLSAIVGLVGGAAGAWALYQRLGPAREIVTSPTQPSGGGAAPLSSLAARVAPSLVRIVTRPLGPADLLGTPQGLAVGFAAGTGGLVVTSAHAVEGATRLRLALPDGHLVDAGIAVTDVAHGLVVLQAAQSSGLPSLRFADAGSSPRPGDVAVAVGAPPLSTTSVTSGVVRSTAREVVTGTDGATVEDVTVVDATPDPADDGAPLLDGAGDVIGVVVASPAGAPPGLLALSGRAAAALVDRAQRGTAVPAAGFGVKWALLDAATAAAVGLAPGALVRSVVPGGPGDAAGLRPGDVVTAAEGVAVDAVHPLDAELLGLVAGQRVSLTVFRAGQEITVLLTIG